MHLLIVIVTIFLLLTSTVHANIADDVFLGAENQNENKSLVFIGGSTYEHLSSTLYIASLYGERPSAEFSTEHAMAMDIYISTPKMSYRTFNNLWRNGIIINMPTAISDIQAEQMAIFYESIQNTLTKADLQLTKGDHIRFLYLPQKGLSISLNHIHLVTLERDILFPLLLAAWTGEVPPSSKFKADITGQSDTVKNRKGLLFSSNFSSRGDPTRNESIRQALALIKESAIEESTLENEQQADEEVTSIAIAATPAPAPEEQQQIAPTQPSEVKIAKVVPKPKTKPTISEEQKRRIAQAKREREALAKAQQDLQKYYLQIRSSIEDIQQYPRLALRKKLSGTVVIAFQVNADGDFQHQLSASSGWKILDSAAIKAVKKAHDSFSGSHLQALPKNLAEDNFEFKIPLVYDYNQARRR